MFQLDDIFFELFKGLFVWVKKGCYECAFWFIDSFQSVPKLFCFFSFEKFVLFLLIYLFDNFEIFFFQISIFVLLGERPSSLLKLVDELVFNLADSCYKIFLPTWSLLESWCYSLKRNLLAFHVRLVFALLAIKIVAYERYLLAFRVDANPLDLVGVATDEPFREVDLECIKHGLQIGILMGGWFCFHTFMIIRLYFDFFYIFNTQWRVK